MFIQSRILKLVVICSCCSFPCSSHLSFSSYSFLLFFLFLVLFSRSVYSVYFLISLMVFFSNLLSLSFLFSYYCSVCPNLGYLAHDKALLAILAILHLCLLRYFPSTNLVHRADNCYTSLYFYFSSFSMFIQSRFSKLVICSCCSFLLSVFFILIFSTLLSIPCSVFSLCLFTLFSDLPYGFLFKSVILSFVFSYYSVLSASPLGTVNKKLSNSLADFVC